MDPFEKMVNEHHDRLRTTAREKRVRKHLNRVISSAVITASFLLCALIGLVHPVLAIPVMISALMFGCYHLGRCVRFGMRWAR